MASIVLPESLPILERRAVTVKNRVQCKQDQVITWLQEFYTVPGNLEKLLPILQGTSPISLRLVDYFVTNYSKKMNTSFVSGGKHFLIYFNYKRELNAYSKRLFDPFCRRERIMFQARGMEAFVTTVGQLNFFRWFIEKGILEYVTEQRESIEKDMNSTLKQHYSRSNTTLSTVTGSAIESAGLSSQTQTLSSVGSSITIGSVNTLGTAGAGTEGEEGENDVGITGISKTPRKKRCELTKSAMKKVNVHECEVTVSFG
jgi:hypothetical protein